MVDRGKSIPATCQQGIRKQKCHVQANNSQPKISKLKSMNSNDKQKSNTQQFRENMLTQKAAEILQKTSDKLITNQKKSALKNLKETDKAYHTIEMHTKEFNVHNILSYNDNVLI